jgi:hypothetical protein
LEPLPPDRWQNHSISFTELDAEDTIIFKVNWSHAHDAMLGPIYLADVRLAAKRNAAGPAYTNPT